ncbi:MAG: low molecular weight phosphotyrosine protein phosphatase [Muribaculaceae bacterium]|nr:low molecular weight phosphotyrosine protein phosphatase [Muribaculaceae bacterium]
MIKILFICHGNICRSTMAQSVFTHMATRLGLLDHFEIDSAATSREELGNPPHYGTVQKLKKENIPLIPHRARQMTRDDYVYYDYLIGMDSENMRGMTRIAGGADSLGKLHKLMEFAGFGEGKSRRVRDVADPWYTGDFEAAYRDITEGLGGFIEYLKEREAL